MLDRLYVTSFVGGLLSITTLGAPALAGGPGAPAEETPLAEVLPAPVSPDWQGSYVGLLFTMPDGENFWYRDGTGPSTTEDFSGKMASLTIGHDWQRGNLVYGLGLSFGSADYVATPQPAALLCDDCKTNVSSMASLRGRLGVAMGKTLVFASAGIVSAETEGTIVGGTPVGDDRLTGTSLGIGIEQMFGEKFSVSIEYMKTDLGRLDLPSLCIATDCYTDIEFNQLQIGMNYHW